MTDEPRYEMNWDCPACGTTGLLALSQKFCPVCGSPQDPKGRYFPPDDAKVAVGDHPYVGADVVCAACDTPNAANAEFCTACGSPLEGSKAAARRDDRVLGEGEVDAGESARDAVAEHREKKQAEEARRRAEMAGQPPPPESPPEDGPPKKGGPPWGLIIGGTVVLLIVLCAGAFSLNSLLASQEALEVTHHTWERSVDIESYGPVQRVDWKDQLPAGAQDVRCTPEKRSTKKVQDGETCKTVKKDLGDGSFKEVEQCKPTYREEPVMADRCQYTVDSWTVSRTLRSEGKGITPAPTWPEVRLSRTGLCRGCEREGRRKETYRVHLQRTDDAERKHSCNLDQSVWSGMAVGSRWIGSVGGLTGALDCAGLEPAP